MPLVYYDFTNGHSLYLTAFWPQIWWGNAQTDDGRPPTDVSCFGGRRSGASQLCQIESVSVSKFIGKGMTIDPEVGSRPFSYALLLTFGLTIYWGLMLVGKGRSLDLQIVRYAQEAVDMNAEGISSHFRV